MRRGSCCSPFYHALEASRSLTQTLFAFYKMLSPYIFPLESDDNSLMKTRQRWTIVLNMEEKLEGVAGQA